MILMKILYNTVQCNFFLALIHTHTNHHHHHHQHDFMCLLNFQVLEAPIVLSGCIISRFPTNFQQIVNPPSSAHICKREPERCINLQSKRPASLNSDFLIAQTLCGQTIRIKRAVVPAAQNINHNTASHRDVQRPQSDDDTILIFSHVPRSSKAK